MRKLPHGLSLIELAIVLALMGVLAMLATPPMAGMIRTYRINTAAGDMLSAIELTRAQAIARGRRVLLVPLDAGGASWREGWIVLLDDDGDRRPSPGEDVIASHGPLARGIDVGARFTSNKLPLYLAFGPSGRSCSDTSSMVARWGTITLRQGGDDIRRIKINMLGRARLCRPDREPDSCEGEGD